MEMVNDTVSVSYKMASNETIKQLGHSREHINEVDNSGFNWPMFEFVSVIVFPVVITLACCFGGFFLCKYYRTWRQYLQHHSLREQKELPMLEIPESETNDSKRCTAELLPLKLANDPTLNYPIHSEEENNEVEEETELGDTGLSYHGGNTLFSSLDATHFSHFNAIQDDKESDEEMVA